MAELVLRPMRPRFRSRRRRVWPYLLLVLLVLLGLGHWFGGVYVTPPSDAAPGRTALVWRADGEPFFNSPAVPGFEDGPAGHVLIEALPFWSYAYRQSRKMAARAEPVTVGGSADVPGEHAAPDADASPQAAATPAASPTARAAAPAPSPAPRAAETPRPAEPRATPSPAPRVAATPAARPRPAAARPDTSPPAVRAERDRRLERIRRELQRIRREADRPNSAGTRPSGAGG